MKKYAGKQKIEKRLTKEHLFFIIPLKEKRGAAMYLSESDLNGIGRDIVRSYSMDEFAPVDIEDLLKKLLGISVEDYTLHPRGLILGMCSSGSQLVKVKKDREIILAELNKNVVFIDSSLNNPWYEGRRNFTIAHEGGHHFLFDLEKQKSGSAQPFCRVVSQSRAFDPDEWKADVLASCLLLPEQNVRNAFYELFQKEHLDTITAFNREIFCKFEDMARFFRVSKTALSIRLKKLGLVNEFNFSRSIAIYNDD
ncbi:MAG: ImmA/IrrE family metallo-endopeptidase [Bacteroidales bacterium]|nr:ImmA/IrrE family metallo-endopeptidase [Bacteroidales bacterium]